MYTLYIITLLTLWNINQYLICTTRIFHVITLVTIPKWITRTKGWTIPDMNTRFTRVVITNILRSSL